MFISPLLRAIEENTESPRLEDMRRPWSPDGEGGGVHLVIANYGKPTCKIFETSWSQCWWLCKHLLLSFVGQRAVSLRQGLVTEVHASLHGQRDVVEVGHGLEREKLPLPAWECLAPPCAYYLRSRPHRMSTPVLWLNGNITEKWKGSRREKCQLCLLISQQIMHRFSPNKSRGSYKTKNLSVETNFHSAFSFPLTLLCLQGKQWFGKPSKYSFLILTNLITS